MATRARQAIDNAKTELAASLAASDAIAGREVKVITSPDHPPLIVTPDGMQVSQNEGWLKAPRLINQGVHLHTPDSFIDYVNLFGSIAQTVVFAKRTSGMIVAVFDYHKATDDPAWTKHRAKVELKLTEDWKQWAALNYTVQNPKVLSQTEFALFIDEHVPTILEPDGLAEIVRDFEATKSGSFKSYKRESDGSVNFSFEEDVKGRVQGGTLTFPTTFKLLLKPYEGQPDEEKRIITARLRFRITGGSLVFWFELERLEEHLEQAFTQVVDRVRNMTDRHVRAVVFGEIGGVQ